ncbi:DUF1059 domain-containing protein [Agrobacterium vitis]|uniref:DUF1059 domain-containing protein n=1 Tax=Rhizobium/Agrobacterium group TaxID=227290 RepID=UPI0008DC210D|nr:MULTISPECIES: DUF1059 domain-containing protein [Rhizobium/Agrobacterium group]MCF1433508.1 DUF1059 domain-containing protein [Allorhizobium ampelinum]MCF1448835.1 DUF1059 domain-containing protein [Allorhizobium ampelinum]MCF1492354.1 DUF1059 domain-containing protein [Allorhizobium ampelinum]MUO90741.1 DUF1059 domain-containing protein [Agrobacterium vitis]MUZ54103.1 DUF1059 domain-containing protein [Agrobacterium vitis]
MKQFECGRLVPGCEWHTHAKEEAEVVHRAVDHIRMVHGDSVIRDNIVPTVRARIIETGGSPMKANRQADDNSANHAA